jgi:maltose operon protein
MKIPLIRPLFLLVTAVVVLGCSKRYATVVRELGEAPVCCASMEELPAEPLQVGDTRNFGLGAGSPAYRFATGKSHFRAFALPEGPYPYRVTVDSFLVGDHLKSAYLFYPQLLTLDKDRRVVRTSGPDTFGLERTGFIEALRQTEGVHRKVTGGLTFGDANRDERYLLVLTTDALLKERTPVPVGGETPVLTLGTTEMELAREQVRVPHAPAGRISLSVVPLSPPPAAGTAPVSGALEASTSAPVSRPETVHVRLLSGKKVGELLLGETDPDRARQLFDTVGAGLGAERSNTTPFAVGAVTLLPPHYFMPPGTPHQLYFDADGRLVLFVDSVPAGLPATGREFRQRFPNARETSRTVSTYELQLPLTTCVTLVAAFRTGNDSLDAVAYGYSCPKR